MPRIDRCYCFGVTLEECKQVAAKTPNCTVQHLTEQLGVGSQCGYCIPYLQHMLRTGCTVFTELLPVEEKHEAE